MYIIPEVGRNTGLVDAGVGRVNRRLRCGHYILMKIAISIYAGQPPEYSDDKIANTTVLIVTSPGQGTITPTAALWGSTLKISCIKTLQLIKLILVRASECSLHILVLFDCFNLLVNYLT
jgi:hypothetical protein